jgi:integrase
VQDLAEVKTRSGNWAAGATENLRGKIVEFLWKLEKDGRKPATIKTYGRILTRMIVEGVDLYNPEQIKGYIAKKPWKESHKIMHVVVLRSFLKFLKIPWDPPRYTAQQEIPFIPTETEIDQLIAAAGKKLAAFLQLLKETGARSGEIAKLTWADVDYEQRIVRVKPEKGSLPRILPISARTVEMLSMLPKTSERIFSSLASTRSNFVNHRRRTARKLANPRIMQIHFHAFRHWRATMEYHKTKDIIHVMQLLGHRNIKNTLIYISIEKALFPAGTSEEFHVKTAKTATEVQALLEAGFDYILEKDGVAFFRKRK